MDLNIYNIIKRPRITEKAYNLNKKLNQLVVEVHPKANKSSIAQALKKLFNVEVEKIRIIVSKGKRRKMGRFSSEGKLKKKAIIVLKKGLSVDIMGLQNAIGPSELKQAEQKG